MSYTCSLILFLKHNSTDEHFLMNNETIINCYVLFALALSPKVRKVLRLEKKNNI